MIGRENMPARAVSQELSSVNNGEPHAAEAPGPGVPQKPQYRCWLPARGQVRQALTEARESLG
jgi:hypothetical protein